MVGACRIQGPSADRTLDSGLPVPWACSSTGRPRVTAMGSGDDLRVGDNGRLMVIFKASEWVGVALDLCAFA